MKEYIIKVDEDKKDIMGNCPLVEKPQELVRCRDCKRHLENNCEVLIGVYYPDWFCADGKRE